MDSLRDRMIDVLSLPRHNHVKTNTVNEYVAHSGLPLNSLPGWEHIPLNSKLPMLKCPDNQVIFSFHKIGQTFKHTKKNFDASITGKIPQYNPLHDEHLKNFYQNERNLKRLRENGEITENNDVICNLKDFNEFRMHLHESQLHYILLELNRVEAEHKDLTMINNAQSITSRDHHNLNARHHSCIGVTTRKALVQAEREKRARNELARTEAKFQRIAGLHEMNKVLLEHKRAVNRMKMQKHYEAATDLLRKRLIRLKKLYQMKSVRLKKNLAKLNLLRSNKSNVTQIIFWEKRLNERIQKEENLKVMMTTLKTERDLFIENHHNTYIDKWEQIQDEIRARSSNLMRTKYPHKRRRSRQKPPSADNSYYKQFSHYSNTGLYPLVKDALQTDAKIAFDNDDPFYKAAQFINQNIVSKYDKDLSADEDCIEHLSEELTAFFEEAKKCVTARALQIIGGVQLHPTQCVQSEPCIRTCGKQVGDGFGNVCERNVIFSCMPISIGDSSYDVHPYVDIKNVQDRTPTPKASLATIVVESMEALQRKSNITHLNIDDMIFLHHHITKFKRELLVGMDKRVFDALRVHFQQKIMNYSSQLLELDRNFIVSQATLAILSYATNSLNYDSALKLSISVLATEIICSLQKDLIKPESDPRFLIRCQSCRTCKTNKSLCVYCCQMDK